MTDSLEARRAALGAERLRAALNYLEAMERRGWEGEDLFSVAVILRDAYLAAARGVESRPPVDVEAALDEWLDELDGSGHTAEVLAQGDRSPFGRLELLGLIRTVTTRED